MSIDFSMFMLIREKLDTFLPVQVQSSKEWEFLNCPPKWKQDKAVIGLSIDQSEDLLHAGYNFAVKETSQLAISFILFKGAITVSYLIQ